MYGICMHMRDNNEQGGGEEDLDDALFSFVGGGE